MSQKISQFISRKENLGDRGEEIYESDGYSGTFLCEIN